MVCIRCHYSNWVDKHYQMYKHCMDFGIDHLIKQSESMYVIVSLTNLHKYLDSCRMLNCNESILQLFEQNYMCHYLHIGKQKFPNIVSLWNWYRIQWSIYRLSWIKSYNESYLYLQNFNIIISCIRQWNDDSSIDNCSITLSTIDRHSYNYICGSSNINWQCIISISITDRNMNLNI